MASKTSLETYNKDFYKKSERMTPRYNRYKKYQFSTLNPDFVNTNDGTVPSTQSNILAIVNKDGSVKKTIMESAVSLSNDGQFMSKANISSDLSQEQAINNQIAHTTISNISNEDKKNSKADKKNNCTDLLLNERRKLSSTKKCGRTKKQIKNLLISEKKLKTALSKHVISNTDQDQKSAHTQTELKNCKHCTDDQKQPGLSRSSEKIQYSKKELNNSKTVIEQPVKINYEELQNKKKLITETHEKLQRIDNSIKDLDSNFITENMIEANKTKNIIKKMNAEGEMFQKIKILGKNNNIKKIGYLNRVCSIFLFVIILCWFLSVVFKMNIPQDFGKIIVRYFTSLPIFTRHKRRELTKAEIGLKWINSFLNILKRVIGL